MSITIESGKWTARWLPKKVSTAFSANSLVSADDGYATPADSTTGAADEPVAGVYPGPAITSASSNYATTAEIMIMVPIGPATIRATVTGTFAATNVGDGFDMSDSVTVNAAANTYKTVTCVKYVSTTEGIFMIGKSLYANVA